MDTALRLLPPLMLGGAAVTLGYLIYDQYSLPQEPKAQENRAKASPVVMGDVSQTQKPATKGDTSVQHPDDVKNKVAEQNNAQARQEILEKQTLQKIAEKLARRRAIQDNAPNPMVNTADTPTSTYDPDSIPSGIGLYLSATTDLAAQATDTVDIE